jgi:hypothetical protein
MKRIVFTSVAFLAVSALVASGVAAQQQYSKALIEEGFYDFVTSGGHISNVNFGGKPKSGIMLAAVNDVAGQVKAYSQSSTFRSKWAEFAKNNDSHPQTPLAMRPLATLRLQNGPDTSQVDKQMQQVLDNTKNLPPDMQAQVRAQIEQARKQMQQNQKDHPQPKLTDEQLLAQEKHRYEEDNRKYQEALAMQTPTDPNGAIKKALRTALEETAGVDYDARLQSRDFVNPEYRSKDSDWKMAYRAGRGPTEAARAFAQKWLAELK